MGGSNDCATFSAKKSVNVIKFYNRSYGVGLGVGVGVGVHFFGVGVGVNKFMKISSGNSILTPVLTPTPILTPSSMNVLNRLFKFNQRRSMI